MKQAKNNILMFVALAALLAVWQIAVAHKQPALNFVPNVQAQTEANPVLHSRGRSCSLGTMAGAFGYSYDGNVMGSAIAAVGPINFDGHGNLSATYNVSLGGRPFQGQFTGVYTVQDDCTGTVRLDLPVLGVSTRGAFVLVNNGKEALFSGTDVGVAVTGVAKRL